MHAIGRAIVLVISIVDESHPRHRNAADQLEALRISGRFVEGFAESAEGLYDLYSPTANFVFAKRSLTSQEIACYASHRKAWKAFLESDSPYALILEDDFRVVDPEIFRVAIRDCEMESGRWDIVKFFEFSRKRVWRRMTFGSTRLVAYKYQSAGAVAYLINRKAAQRLLKRKRIFRPVDEDLSWNWEFGLRLWTTEHNLVDEVSDVLGGSHIQGARMLAKTNRHAVRTAWANVIQAWKLGRSVVHHARCFLERR